MDINFVEALKGLALSTGFAMITWQQLVMLGISFILLYLALVKQFEPLLLLPIAFGMLLVNLPMAMGSGLMDGPVSTLRMMNSPLELANGEHLFELTDGLNSLYLGLKTQVGGLFYYLYQGVKLGIYPPLIFMGVGAMTDFGPLIANPKTFLLGAAAQLGIFFVFIVALLLDFDVREAASTAIIGGADGPTALYLTAKLAPHLLGPIAIAAYSYMALVPIIQPPIMRLLTTKEMRMVQMDQMREVSKTEKIIFPIAVTVIVVLLLPDAAPLIGMLMLGNLFRESGVVARLSDTVQNALINIITIFLGVTVGATASAETFLDPKTLKIIIMGLVAFGVGTAGGVLLGVAMYYATGKKVNPLIGSAGVSAVPMAARVSQIVGQKDNPKNFLLMHAMGPNVAGVIGSAVAAGVLLNLFK
ncbi:MAG: sodium ion-translocating decarboxylase subunit beta [Peptococcaceae bacterium]|jgi:oxaloacetate decarboxylase beta subunit|nr:sodium ion-translocating decarboxylase subunit beta [Peptococcaceae bacterium]